MSKVVNTTNCFLQTDYNGEVDDYRNNSVQAGWGGNNDADFRVEVSGMTLSCEAHQRIRATPMAIEFNKSMLPVVNRGNYVFFLVDDSVVPTTLTAVTIPVGDVVCVSDGGYPILNSLMNVINKGLEAVNPAWGQGGVSFSVAVEQSNVFNTPATLRNYVGHLKFRNTPAGVTPVCIRDTNFKNGVSVYNSSAHQLMGGLLNEVHFAGAVPTAAEIAGLGQMYSFTDPGGEDYMGRPPYLSPLDHVYLRSSSLLPNGLGQILKGTNISSGLIQSNILCRIPWNEGDNSALAGYGGMTFSRLDNQPTAELPPNVLSGYSGDKSQWTWRNQSGRDFSFFVPSNIISQIQVELTNFQGTALTELGDFDGSNTAYPLRKNGYGIFVTLKFDILE